MSEVFVQLTELAGVIVQLDELAEERKEANKEFGERKKALSKQAHALSQAIRHKGEYRDTQASMFTLPQQRQRKDDA